jgi:hypothetical protein
MRNDLLPTLPLRRALGLVLALARLLGGGAPAQTNLAGDDLSSPGLTEADLTRE